MNAHRAVLACASPYLFQLFGTEGDGYKLDPKHHYKLDSVDYDSFNILLNYIYTARYVDTCLVTCNKISLTVPPYLSES